MKIIKHSEGIYEIENFLTIEEQSIFLSSCDDEGWIESHRGNITKDMTPKQKAQMNNALIRLGKFFNNMDSFTTVTNLRRLKPGEFMWPHIDGGDPSNPKSIVFGIAIYLNDDFSGGELYYSDIDLNIIPKSRSAVIHDAKFNHEVKQVIAGNRYSITVFVFGDKATEFNGWQNYLEKGGESNDRQTNP